MKKLQSAAGIILLSSIFSGCSQPEDSDPSVRNETTHTETTEESKSKSESGNEIPVKPEEHPAKTEESTDTPPSDISVEEEQQQMALDMLDELTKDAKEGKIYRPGDEWTIGHTTRKEIHQTIGKPEEIEGAFEHYHGSMGNPSVAFKFDGNGVLEESRYFGTNVERQTNLGGITEKELQEQLGTPADTRLIQTTGETNIIYHLNHYELQFVMGKDGKADHVNLKKLD
ncbi:YjgB family protein [Sporosarcina sp.]|uniref:YjgB family protein n=1 Tax=Sporosarcina sp. TaxID=49982 RepID=UPI0026026BE5|nr:YjgB family protein [Sporosarcina sp.]